MRALSVATCRTTIQPMLYPVKLCRRGQPSPPRPNPQQPHYYDRVYPCVCVCVCMACLCVCVCRQFGSMWRGIWDKEKIENSEEGEDDRKMMIEREGDDNKKKTKIPAREMGKCDPIMGWQ